MDSGILGQAVCEASHGACDVCAMTVAVIVVCGVIAVVGAHSAISRCIIELFMEGVDALRTES